MEIKDRVAIGDNLFVMRTLEEVGEFKKVVLERTPTEVIEEGTPINKELLQPLVDAVTLVDISDDFAEVIQEEGFVNEVEMTVKKCGNVISGMVVLMNTSGTGFLEKFQLKINSKYAGSVPYIVNCLTVDNSEKLSVSNAVAIINDTDIYFEWMQNSGDFVSVQFSFTYLCKGDTENGNS